jgi:hypothetical protein
MRTSTRLGITALLATATLGIASHLSSEKSSDLNKVPKVKNEHSQNLDASTETTPIKSSHYTEPTKPEEKPQDIYKGPRSLLQFLNNQTYGFNDPNNFFGTSERQITDFQKVQREIYNWAKEKGYEVKLSESQKGNQENNRWPAGVLTLDLGEGITYNARILNRQISTTINTPERMHLIVSNLTPSKKTPNSYQFTIADNKRKGTILEGGSFRDSWCELHFDYNTGRMTENQVRMSTSKGYWNKDLKGVVHKIVLDPIISIPEERYLGIIQEQRDLNNLFKSNFPKTTRYIK